jgi:hypothetical protein
VRLEPAAFSALATGGPPAYRIAADWLLERGDPRGEFILDELALFERPSPSTRKAILARRTQRKPSLFAQWEEPLRALGVTECSYRWGFVERVRLPEKALGDLPKLLALEPITKLEVALSDGVWLTEAMRSPAFAQIRSLELTGRRAPVLNVAAPQIETLALQVPPGTIEKVCELFPGLKRLHVNGGMNGSAAVDALTSGKLNVKELWAPHTHVSSASVVALARSTRAVESLGLAFNDLGRNALNALGASQTLTSLRELDLRGWYTQSAGFLTTGLPALKKLRVSRPTIEDRKLYARRGISLNC